MDSPSPPQPAFAAVMGYPPPSPARSLPSSPRSSFSSLSPPPSIAAVYRPPSRSSLYPSRSSPTLPALAEDSIASLEPLPLRPLSLLIDDAARADAYVPLRTVDHVDQMNSIDPFGGLWHNDSPYDACLPVPSYNPRSRPQSMIFLPAGGVPADGPGTFSRSRRSSVLAPSPLSQTTSAASFGSPSSVSLSSTPSPSHRRISFVIDPLDDYPYTREEALFAHVQMAKQERRDAALRAQEEQAQQRALAAAEAEKNARRGFLGIFRRKSRSASPAPKAKPAREKKEKKLAEKEPQAEKGGAPSQPQRSRTISRSFSLLSRKGTKLKRRPSERKPLLPAAAPAPLPIPLPMPASAGPSTPEPPVPEYRTTPFDPAVAVAPTPPAPTGSPAPAYALVDPASIPIPPSPELELPEPPLLSPPPRAQFTQQDRPSLPSLQHDSADGSGTEGDYESSEAVMTPEMPSTPLEGKQGERGEYMPVQPIDLQSQVTVKPVLDAVVAAAPQISVASAA
ncbi:hypothetical protein CALCODRAFT_479527 [Calocera cornea HHB12733]|uniref:Uncharacterized protein n=1 Tax=Calocera cornea HHB12733 TaxID=1353952 RepID=A0A165JMR3_9BASI|nr:hypothetical protein CALCODRAFT_479527 [Calocera cornea HHB12733]